MSWFWRLAASVSKIAGNPDSPITAFGRLLSVKLQWTVKSCKTQRNLTAI
jgi:hypothetical protein